MRETNVMVVMFYRTIVTLVMFVLRVFAVMLLGAAWIRHLTALNIRGATQSKNTGTQARDHAENQ